MRQRVLVLGAGGFVGRRVIAALARSGWALPVAAARREVSFPGVGETELLRLDATDAVAVSRALPGISAVVNCVTGDPDTIVGGARILFEAAAQIPAPPRIVHLSSLAVYGSAVGEVDESAPLSGDLSAYGDAKVRAEGMAARYPAAVVFRPGIIYGPASPLWSDSIGRMLLAGRLGDLGAAGQGICNLVHVDDVATAVVTALAANAAAVEGRAFNLSIPAPPTWNEYFHLYARALGAPPLLRFSSARLAFEVRARGPMLKAVSLLTRRSGAPPLRPWLLQLCRHEITMRAHLVEQTLGIRWTNLQAGLAEAADWLLKHPER